MSTLSLCALSPRVTAALLVLLIAACGGDTILDPTQTPTETPVPTATRSLTVTPTETHLPTAEPDPTPTATPEPTATSTPRPSPTVTQTPETPESTTQVQIDPVLSEIFARLGLSAEELSEAESTCLREWAGDIDPAIFTSAAQPPGAMAEVVACIPDVFISEMIARMGLSYGDLSEAESSCLREWAGDIDPAIFTSAEPPPEAVAEVVACIPDVFISDMIERMGLSYEHLSEAESSCLREWGGDIDPAIFASAAPPPGAMAEVIACIPDVFVSEMIAGMGLSAEDLSEAESTCLRGQMSSFDWSAVEEDAVAAVISDLFLCIPARFASLMVAESGLSDVLGFHPEDLGEEVALCIGNSMASLDWTALVTNDPAATAEVAAALYSCAPKLLIDLAIKEFGMGAEYIGEVQEACLNKWASDIDWKNVFSDAPDAFLGLESGFRACLPEVHLSEDGDATG